VRRDEREGIAARRDDAPGRKAEWNRGPLAHADAPHEALSGTRCRSRPSAGYRFAGIRLRYCRTPHHGGWVQQEAPHERGENSLLGGRAAGGRIPVAGAAFIRRRLEYRRPPARRNRRDVGMRGALRQIGDARLDRYVAAPQSRNDGLHLVLEAEGRRPW
jgi:hypothetical protein